MKPWLKNIIGLRERRHGFALCNEASTQDNDFCHAFHPTPGTLLLSNAEARGAVDPGLLPFDHESRGSARRVTRAIGLLETP